MARRNANLAGLAALGALGYMATRGGDKDAVKTEAAPARAEPTLEELARGSRDLEGGITPQGLNESGDRYSLEPTAPPRLAAKNRPAANTNRSMAGSRSMPSADEDFPAAPAAKPRRSNVAGDYTRKMGATAEEIANYRNRITSPRPNTTYTHQLEAVRARKAAERAAAENMGMKKGGAVKADVYKDANAALKGAKKRGEKSVTFKMASGGSTSSASKRADGIASRGKTKCKMY